MLFVSLIHSSTQQYWKNDKILKQWQQLSPSSQESNSNSNSNNFFSNQNSQNNQNNFNAPPPPPQPQPQQQPQPSGSSGFGNFVGSFSLPNNNNNNNNNEYNIPAPQPAPQPSYNQPAPPVPSYNQPAPPAPAPAPAPQPSYNVQPAPLPAYNPPAPIQPAPISPYNFANVPNVQFPFHHQLPIPVPAPAPVPALHAGFPIQQPTITNTGETIIENLVGGIPFDCRGRPSGHWRDGRFCDIFHACVFGMQRKTYACPFVGERTYFDEITRRLVLFLFFF